MPRCLISKVLMGFVLFSALPVVAAQQSGAGSSTTIQVNAIVHFFKGANFQRDGDMNRALEEYRQAVSLDDQFAEAFNNMGTVFFQRNDYGRATEYYEKALELH